MYIFGAGGHAKVVARSMESARMALAGFVVSTKDASTYCGYPVVSEEEFDRLAEPRCLIIGVGEGQSREAVASRLERAGRITFLSVVDASAAIQKGATLGAGCFVAPRAAVNADAAIAEHCIVNTAAVVEHDVTLGAYSMVAPGAVLCGKVRIGAHSFCGAGSVVIQNLTLGPRIVVAAGAVVTRSFPEGNVVLGGIPARAIADYRGDLVLS